MKNNNVKSPKVFLLWAALSVTFAALIFLFSAQNGEASGSLSEGIIKSLISGIVRAENLDTAEKILRKLAHFGIYLLLGLSLFYTAFYYKNNCAVCKSCVASFAISVLYAASDEIHQRLVPGRHGAVSDVFIDAVGAVCGIIIAVIILKAYVKANKSKKPAQTEQVR